jgi:hypothetical protein
VQASWRELLFRHAVRFSAEKYLREKSAEEVRAESVISTGGETKKTL